MLLEFHGKRVQWDQVPKHAQGNTENQVYIADIGAVKVKVDEACVLEKDKELKDVIAGP